MNDTHRPPRRTIETELVQRARQIARLEAKLRRLAEQSRELTDQLRLAKIDLRAIATDAVTFGMPAPAPAPMNDPTEEAPGDARL